MESEEVHMAAKSFISEFKTFISRGNVMDLAVGVIIGGAFQTIVSSLVNDIVMPEVLSYNTFLRHCRFHSWNQSVHCSYPD